MPDVIDRASPVPYYEQLLEILRAGIELGGLPVGARLPSEMDLCRSYGLSRATVRQTLAKLESTGYARRVPRRGMFVSRPESPEGWIVQNAEGFLELQLQHASHGVTTVVISAQYVAPPRRVASALGAGAGEQIFELRRVRSLQGRAAMFSTNWFCTPAGRAVAADASVLDGSGSVNRTLRNAGFHIAKAHRVISALCAPRDVAEHLRVSADQPLIRVQSLSWDTDGEILDLYETWVLTEVVPLEVNVFAPPSMNPV